jgi:hypothetical protein
MMVVVVTLVGLAAMSGGAAAQELPMDHDDPREEDLEVSDENGGTIELSIKKPYKTSNFSKSGSIDVDTMDSYDGGGNITVVGADETYTNSDDTIEWSYEYNIPAETIGNGSQGASETIRVIANGITVYNVSFTLSDPKIKEVTIHHSDMSNATEDSVVKLQLDKYEFVEDESALTGEKDGNLMYADMIFSPAEDEIIPTRTHGDVNPDRMTDEINVTQRWKGMEFEMIADRAENENRNITVRVPDSTEQIYIDDKVVYEESNDDGLLGGGVGGSDSSGTTVLLLIAVVAVAALARD